MCSAFTFFILRTVELSLSCSPRQLEQLTCVIVPDSYFGEVSHAEDFWEAKRVNLLALKLVGLVALFQRQCPRVPVLSKNNDPHVGISACP